MTGAPLAIYDNEHICVPPPTVNIRCSAPSRKLAFFSVNDSDICAIGNNDSHSSMSGGSQ